MDVSKERIDGLRRAVQYGLDNGKKNMIVDLDCLSALFRGEIPVGNNELPPEEVTARLYSIKEQRDHLIHSCRIALENLQWTIKNKQSGLVTGHDAQSLKVLKEALAKAAGAPQPKPTIQELEAILNSEENTPVYVWPDGSCHAEPYPSTEVTRHVLQISGDTPPMTQRLPDDPPDEAFRSPEDERWHLGMLKTDKDLLKIAVKKTHGCHACGEERFPRVVAGKLTCPDCGSEKIVCIEP